MEDTETRNYIRENMSKENARTFLEMKGRSLSEYDAILLTAKSEDAPSFFSGLEQLAKTAMENACEFVTSVGVEVYAQPTLTPMPPVPGEIYDPVAQTKGQSFFAGTGLIPKK